LQIIGDRLPHHRIVIDDKNVAHLAGSPGIPPLLVSIADCSPAKGSDNRTRFKQAFGCPSIMGFAGRWNEFGFQSSARVGLSASLQRCATSGQRSPIRRHCLQEGPALGPRYGTSFTSVSNPGHVTIVTKFFSIGTDPQHEPPTSSAADGIAF
jgi:hypothetical protein